LKCKWVKGNDVIPRHSPKLGTSQGDANTNDELLLRWSWYHDWGKKNLKHPAKPAVLLLKYLHLPLQNSIFIAKLIGDLKGFLCCREGALMACKYSPLGTPRGRYDEHSSKSSLSCETKVYRTSRRKPNFRR
jgi:hypothetical protein